MGIYKNGVWKQSGSPNKNYILNSNFIGKQDSGIITFNGDEAIFSTNTLGQTSGISFGLAVDTLGKTDFKNKTLTFSVEYKIDTALTFGTTNPWVGCQLGITRDTSTGGSSQWLSWYGSKTIPTAVTNGWIKHSVQVNVSNYDIASLSWNMYLRDTTGKISYRHPKIEVGNVATAWILNENDTYYVGDTHSFIEYTNKAKIQNNGYVEANSFIEI